MELMLTVFSGEQTDDLARLQAAAFCQNNPFIQPLGLTFEDMYNEFHSALADNQYKLVLVFYNKATYAQGDREIIGCFCFCDAVWFTPPENVDFTQVPTKTEVRKYMKYYCLQKIYKKYEPKEGEMLFGTSFVVNPKYMGQNLGNVIVLHTLDYLVENCKFTYVVGNAINIFSKKIASQLQLPEYEIFDLSNMIVLDEDTMPFKGLNLTQEAYLFDISKSREVFRSYLSSKLKPRL